MSYQIAINKTLTRKQEDMIYRIFSGALITENEPDRARRANVAADCERETWERIVSALRGMGRLYDSEQ